MLAIYGFSCYDGLWIGKAYPAARLRVSPRLSPSPRVRLRVRVGSPRVGPRPR